MGRPVHVTKSPLHFPSSDISGLSHSCLDVWFFCLSHSSRFLCWADSPYLKSSSNGNCEFQESRSRALSGWHCRTVFSEAHLMARLFCKSSISSLGLAWYTADVEEMFEQSGCPGQISLAVIFSGTSVIPLRNFFYLPFLFWIF